MIPHHSTVIPKQRGLDGCSQYRVAVLVPRATWAGPCSLPVGCDVMCCAEVLRTWSSERHKRDLLSWSQFPRNGFVDEMEGIAPVSLGTRRTFRLQPRAAGNVDGRRLRSGSTRSANESRRTTTSTSGRWVWQGHPRHRPATRRRGTAPVGWGRSIPRRNTDRPLLPSLEAQVLPEGTPRPALLLSSLRCGLDRRAQKLHQSSPGHHHASPEAEHWDGEGTRVREPVSQRLRDSETGGCLAHGQRERRRRSAVCVFHVVHTARDATLRSTRGRALHRFVTRTPACYTDLHGRGGQKSLLLRALRTVKYLVDR